MIHTSSYAQVSDSQLVLQMQQGNNSMAFDELYRRYYQKLAAYSVKKFQCEPHEVHDLMQDVFVKAYQKIDSLKNPELVSPWLYRITHNQIVTRIRRKKVLPTTSLEAAHRISDEEATYQEQADLEAHIESLPKVMQMLSPEYQDIIQMKYLDGHSLIDISEKYGLTISAVKMRLLRAKSKMAVIYDSKAIRARA